MTDGALTTQPAKARSDAWPRLRSALSVRNISAVYVWIVLFVVFALWVPETFLTQGTLKSVLGQYSVTTLAALALVMPLAAGVFDLSVGQIIGATAVTIAWAVQHDWSWPTAVVLGVAVGLVAGALSALAVRLGINSFIATLGMSSILAAYVDFRSKKAQLTIPERDFRNIFLKELWGVPRSFYIALCIAAVLWYVLTKRPFGRHVHATGGNTEAARLAGVRTHVIVFVALITSAFIAALAGVMNAGRSGVGSPTVGPSFLIPAFAAAFLGSTQLRRGEFNVWGTVIAVYVLATGVKGLQLAGAQDYVTDLFNGVALLLAVGVSRWERRTVTAGTAARRARRAAREERSTPG